MKFELLPQTLNNTPDIWSVGKKVVKFESGSKTIKLEIKNLLIYIEGEFYYYVDNQKKVAITESNQQEILTYIFTKHPVSDIPHVLEGMYSIVIYDKSGTVYAIADLFNRKNFFYTNTEDTFTVSTELTDVLGETVKYSQKGLYSYLLLGYTPVKDTFYEGVFRLGVDEMITVTNDQISFSTNEKPKNIIDYDKSYLNKYNDIITNAVTTRASNKGNVVMNSGGWDSTSIVYLLSENFDRKEISSVVIEIILSDKQSFNVYEVDKVRRISEHFEIDTETVKIDYSDKSSIDVWERNLENLRNNHVYFWMHHIRLAEEVGSGIGKNKSIFSGEASDSIHNFGFSQFVSVNYENMALREYADKAKSFLFGPTFLSEILDDSYTKDKVFNFFNNYYGVDKFDIPLGKGKHEVINKYLQSFMLSYPRVPFAKWQNTTVVKNEMNSDFEQFVNKKYFNKISDSISQENLYYKLLQVYRDFHFHSAQIEIGNVAFGKYDLTCKMPFLDMNMVDFMYSMPENWGRGLEIRTTKYPLRYLANEKWSNLPLSILEEKGPHSYIAEKDSKWTYAGGNWDIYCEIMYKSVFKEYFREKLSKIDVETYFDSNYFDTKKLNAIIKDYVEGKEDIPNHGLLFKLAVLFTIGLIEK